MAWRAAFHELVGIPFLSRDCSNLQNSPTPARTLFSPLVPRFGTSALRRSFGAGFCGHVRRCGEPPGMLSCESDAREDPGGGLAGPETAEIYYYELREATAAMKERAAKEKREQAVRILDVFVSTASGSRGTAQLDYEKSSEADESPSEAAESEPETGKLEESQDLYSSRPRKIPIESNGPPMMTLQPYLSPDSPEEILRPLPLIMPHKLRPLGLPRASLRRRLGMVIPSRSSVQAGEFTENLAAEIRDLPGRTGVSRVLKKWVWKLKKGSLAKTVRELGRMRLTKRVLQVLSWLERRPHLWPDHTTLCTSIQVLVEAGETDIACEVQSTVGRDSEQAAQTLATSLAKAGMFSESVEILNLMKRSGWKIDGTVHTKLIQWAWRTGGHDIVERLLTDLRELNLTSQGYRSIMASCSKLNLVDGVEKVFFQFKASGLRPDIGVYTALISAFTREGKYREAVDLFGEIEEAGCLPDLLGYQVMLNACAKLGDLDSAFRVYEGMTNAGFDPTPEVYNTLIQLHHTSGRTSGAKDLITEMQSKGFVPSAETRACLSSLAVV